MSHRELAWPCRLLKPRMRTQRQPVESRICRLTGSRRLEKVQLPAQSRGRPEACGFSERGDGRTEFKGTSRLYLSLSRDSVNQQHLEQITLL